MAKVRGAKKKSLKIGSGKKPSYPEEEQQVVANAIEQRRLGCCVSYASMAADCMLRVPNLLVPTSKWNNLISAADITEKLLGRLQNSLDS